MVCAASIAVAIGVSLATGSRPFTRFHDKEVANVSETDDLSGLFGETGLADQHGELESVDSRFALGWLPSGPGRASLSVMTIAGFAVVVGAVAVFLDVRRRKAPASE